MARRGGTLVGMPDAPVVDNVDAPIVEDPVADGLDTAPVDGDLWVVGDFNGQRVVSDTDMPDDDTLVWLEDAPDDKMSLADFDEAQGEGVVGWLAEPEPYEEQVYEELPPVDTPPAPADTPDAVVAAVDGAMTLDALEEKLDAVEALLASAMLDLMEDERYTEDEPDSDADDLAMPARTAAALKEFMAELTDAANEARTAAFGDPKQDKLNALNDMGSDAFNPDPGNGDTPDDSVDDNSSEDQPGDEPETGPADEQQERLDKILSRLSKVESSLADLITTLAPGDEEIMEDPQSASTVDERPDLDA